MNSKDFGDIGEDQVLLAFLKKGYHVSIPFDDNSPYDLVVDIEGKLKKVQCKYASMKENGSIPIYRYSTTRRSNSKKEDDSVFIKNTYNDIDFIAAYCPDTDKVYLVPLHSFEDKLILTLRITPPANGVTKGVNFASDYELK